MADVLLDARTRGALGYSPPVSDSSAGGSAILCRGASAQLLGQPDDDALRATQEAEPVAVLVLRELADERCTVAAQAGNDVVDVLDGEHDSAYAQCVRRRVLRLGSDRRRRVVL